MKEKFLGSLVDRFIGTVNFLMNEKVISTKDLEEYTESNLHSWLQYALIKAGEKEGLFAVPEVKLRFSKPLDPNWYGLNRKRKRHLSRVDVGFYRFHDESKRRELVGIAEIFTLDEAHGCLPSKKLIENGHYWLTPRDSLSHAVQYAMDQPKFIILVTVLLKMSPHIPWKTKIEEIDSELMRHRNYYKVFKPCWKKFKESLHLESALLIINEEGIEIV
ncbi:MAG: hypothetical protein DRN18_00150 [Thermoplasmata archaeon]|nr:MAG: hypothetical protein DRN18_00150 [Thermoplasmata archaeon]